jgi:hypothetical protein
VTTITLSSKKYNRIRAITITESRYESRPRKQILREILKEILMEFTADQSVTLETFNKNHISLHPFSSNF